MLRIALLIIFMFSAVTMSSLLGDSRQFEIKLLGILCAPLLGSVLVLTGGRSMARFSNVISIGLLGYSLLGCTWLWGRIPEDVMYQISTESSDIGILYLDLWDRGVKLSLAFKFGRVEVILFGIINTIAVVACGYLSVGHHSKFWEVAIVIPLGAFAAAQAVVGYNFLQVLVGFQVFSLCLTAFLSEGLGHPPREKFAGGVEILFVCFAQHSWEVFYSLDYGEIIYIAPLRTDPLPLLHVSPVDILAACLLFSVVDLLTSILQGAVRMGKAVRAGKDPEVLVEAAFFVRMALLCFLSLLQVWQLKRALLLSGLLGGWVFKLIVMIEFACSLFFR